MSRNYRYDPDAPKKMTPEQRRALKDHNRFLAKLAKRGVPNRRQQQRLKQNAIDNAAISDIVKAMGTEDAKKIAEAMRRPETLDEEKEAAKSKQFFS